MLRFIQMEQIDYKYDLISGNVNEVYYQPGAADQFIHRYSYDADNRITQVFTSQDGVIWDEDAKYFYYDHGPLSRVEIGDQQIQGIDFAYTIQGWIKGVNSGTLKANRGMGKDGYSGQNINVNANFAPDEAGYTLGYFNGDYKAINSAGITHFESVTENSGLSVASNNLYNGNISHMVTAIGGLMANNTALASVYRYDQLNRIASARRHQAASTDFSNIWGTGTEKLDYSEDFTYDDNGNILTAKRNGTGSTSNNTYTGLDDLNYLYENKITGFEHNTNKLRQVTDDALANPYDLDMKGGQTAKNYEYDEIGNLIRDNQEKIASITWTVGGKIKEVKHVNDGSSSKPDLEFAYDPSGNRIMKIVKSRTSGILQTQDKWDYTFYVRDASGNVMATYKRNFDNISGYKDHLKIQEFSLYGSKRLGIKNIPSLEVSSAPFTISSIDAASGRFVGRNYTAAATQAAAFADRASRTLGLKNFELSNHLGNVLTTVSDKKKVEANTAGKSYEFGFESPTDMPSQGWGGWSFSQQEKFTGTQSVKVTGLAHSFNINVNPGDIISAQAMMKFITGTQGGFIYMALQDANGQNEIGAKSSQHDLASHQNKDAWTQIVYPETVVPAGNTNFYFICV
jgi:hypothetical protein